MHQSVLERFLVYNSEPIHTLVEKGPTLSRAQCSKIDDNIKMMNNIPNPSVIVRLM